MKSAVVVRLCLPFNWSITTASLPWSTENSKTAVTCVFLSCKRGEGRRGRLLSYCIEWKTKHTRTSTSSRTGLTQSLQSILAYLFDGALLLSVTNRRRKTTKDVGHTLRQFRCGFFVTKNQAVAKCQSILEWVPCLLWRQKAAWHIWLFFLRMTTWHALFCRWSFSPAAWNLRIVFGTRACNDVLHTLGGSYLFYKTQVSMIISTLWQKTVKKKKKRKKSVMQKNHFFESFRSEPVKQVSYRPWCSTSGYCV